MLVLGSLPGRRSLELRQYYGLPRNQFWRIMAQVLGFEAGAPYAQRLRALRRSRVALWDVCASAERSGSLDTAIRQASVRANDFAAFFRAHRHIRAICFNGRKAEQLYLRLVRPGLPPGNAGMSLLLLPSTSPAHAGMDHAAKLRRWRVVARLADAAGEVVSRR